MLALMYGSGFGVEQNSDSSVQWHLKAAVLGSIDSIYFLGTNYLTGEFLEKDLEKAIHWLNIGAQKEHLLSIYRLGQIYLSDELGKKDAIVSFNYFLNAARLDHHESQKQVAYMYKEGIGTMRNSMKADYWIAKITIHSEKEM